MELLGGKKAAGQVNEKNAPKAPPAASAPNKPPAPAKKAPTATAAKVIDLFSKKKRRRILMTFTNKVKSFM